MTTTSPPRALNGVSSGAAPAAPEIAPPDAPALPQLDTHRRQAIRDRVIFLVAAAVAVLLLVAGSRTLQGLPLLNRTYDLVAEWPVAEGLLPGAAVHLRGIAVGQVHSVELAPDGSAVRAVLRIDETAPPVYPGTAAVLGGVSALRNVYVDLDPAPARGAPLGDGDRLATGGTGGALAAMVDRAPALADSTAATLAAAAAAARETQALMAGLRSDAQAALRSTAAAGDATASLAGSASATLDAQAARLDRSLDGVDALTAALTATALRADAVAAQLDPEGTQRALARTLDASAEAAAETRRTAAELTALAAALRSPDGTLGRLASDPALYDRTTSVVARLDTLLAGFEADPGRYLREVRLIKVF